MPVNTSTRRFFATPCSLSRPATIVGAATTRLMRSAIATRPSGAGPIGQPFSGWCIGSGSHGRSGTASDAASVAAGRECGTNVGTGGALASPLARVLRNSSARWLSGATSVCGAWSSRSVGTAVLCATVGVGATSTTSAGVSTIAGIDGKSTCADRSAVQAVTLSAGAGVESSGMTRAGSSAGVPLSRIVALSRMAGVSTTVTAISTCSASMSACRRLVSALAIRRWFTAAGCSDRAESN